MATQDEMDATAQRRQAVEDEQFRLMQEQSRQQAERQSRDNAAAERMRTFGEDVPKGKRAGEDYLRGAETVAGPTGPTSSQFAGQTLSEQEGESDGGSGDR